ncbi:hypothetical protein [Microbulbifer taiwanensis]|uniref:Uncharacterized protein n=2 Tax=Microbulbifer taiwanensis TaxID=986746 RepID=A0ABW1YPK8_9GAMM|nr:hypothetical protein [Microbulbifer taiwanensis]
MNRITVGLATVLVALGLSVNTLAKEWYEGGTLSSAGVLEWQSATAENKLASSADFVAVLYQKEMLSPSISGKITSIEDIKPYAVDLATCIEGASEKESDLEKNKRMYANETVASLASICILMMGWGR